MDIDEKLGTSLFQIIEDNLNITKGELLGKDRRSNVIDAKRILIASINNNSGFGRTSIGRFLNIHHGTVINHIKKHEWLINSDKNYKYKYDKVKLLFNNLFVKYKSLEWRLDDLITERKGINKEINNIRKKIKIYGRVCK